MKANPDKLKLPKKRSFRRYKYAIIITLFLGGIWQLDTVSYPSVALNKQLIPITPFWYMWNTDAFIMWILWLFVIFIIALVKKK